MELSKIRFTVKKEDDKYIVYDQEGNWYGRYTNKKEADEAADGWKEYYYGPNTSS